MKLMIFGGGDLSQRVLALLQLVPQLSEVVVVTHDRARGNSLARLFRGCIPLGIRAASIENGAKDGLASLLDRECPDIIFQASSMISPWILAERDTSLSRAIGAAGFGLMLPAQIPMIRQVMRTVRQLRLDCPVVNASYPDATHQILASEGLAPTIGVGNAGMLFNVLRRGIRLRRPDSVPQLFAHHAQVTPFVRRESYARDIGPWLFLDGQPSEVDEFIDGPLPSGRLLNALTASHTIEILAALLSDGQILRTSAPGPCGLPGGWPVRVSSAGVELDLPSGVTVEQGLQYQAHAAAGDGIARVDADGTVHYTKTAQDGLASIAPRLVEPLGRDDVIARLTELRSRLAA